MGETRAQWLRQHAGKLDLGRRLAFYSRAMVARIAGLRANGRPALPAAALEQLPQPTGPLARHADGIVAPLLPAWLLAHSSRTYLWGAALAVRDGLRFDADLLYAAAMLHDLGLCERHTPPAGTCFAVWGAERAEEALLERGVDAGVAGQISAAVALHLDVSVGLHEGVEAHLLNRGAALDVIGREAKALERALRDAVCERAPRQQCKAQLVPVLRAQAKASPGTRTSLLVGLGFLGLIRAAPFDE